MKKNKKKIEKPNYFNSSRFNYLLLFLISSFAVLITFTKLNGEDDLFWHLYTGKFILENGYVPSTDVFGFATQGVKWIPFEWGWDVMTFIFFNAGGFIINYMFAALILLTILFISYRIFIKLDYETTFIVFYFILVLIGIKYRIGLKPQMISYLFLSLTSFILIKVRYFSSSYKTLLFVPLIFFVWSNYHMGVLSGYLLFALFILSELINYFKKRNCYINKSEKIPELKFLIIASLVTVIAAFLNPNGFNTYIYAVSHTRLELIGEIYEWLSPFHENYFGKLFMIIYVLFGIFSIPLIYKSFKRRDYFGGFVLMLFLSYSLRAVRFTADFIIMSLFLFPLLIKTTNTYTSLITFFSNRKASLNVVILFILILLIVLTPGGTLFRLIGFNSVFGIGIYEETFPVKMYDFIKKNQIHQIGNRPFQTLEYGGYFLWNFDKKNFIDSRNLNDSIYYEFKSIMNKSRNYEDKIQKYDFDYFVIFNPLLTSSPKYMESTIVSYLSTNAKKWKLIYFDDKSLLFIKDTTYFKNIIDEYEYQHFTPFNLAYRRHLVERAFKDDYQRIISEYKRQKSSEPSSWFLRNFENIFRNYLTNEK